MLALVAEVRMKSEYLLCIDRSGGRDRLWDHACARLHGFGQASYLWIKSIAN